MLIYSAVMVVSARNIVHSAFYLATTLVCVAVYFIMLRAQYLAAIQILVYVGAVVVLILFALMLTRTAVGDHTNVSSKQTAFAAVVAFLLFAALAIVFYITNIHGEDGNVSGIAVTSINDFSGILFSKYALPFEVASVLLLAALVGSVVLAIRGKHDAGDGEQKQIVGNAADGKKRKTK